MRVALLACGLSVALSAGCARQEETSQNQLTDDALRELVETRLRSDSNVGRLDLNVTADGEHRAVELEGLAYTQRQRTSAVALARAAAPDVVVQDKIEVKPYEIPRDLFDDDMMAEVRADASKMGDELGESMDDGWLHMKVVAKLAADSQTPARTINVDVTDRVVTLRGRVPSQDSRDRAEAVAKGVSGVTGVRNRLVIER
jgi:osmotically-inducible protein OsmY